MITSYGLSFSWSPSSDHYPDLVFVDIPKHDRVQRVHPLDRVDEQLSNAIQGRVHCIGEQPSPEIHKFIPIFVSGSLKYR